MKYNKIKQKELAEKRQELFIRDQNIIDDFLNLQNNTLIELSKKYNVSQYIINKTINDYFKYLKKIKL